MTTMLEKAARAAAVADSEWSWSDQLGWGETIARAVLMAVREPDESVDMAGAVVGPDTNSGEFSLFDARNVFTAMIDHILSEPATAPDVTDA